MISIVCVDVGYLSTTKKQDAKYNYYTHVCMLAHTHTLKQTRTHTRTPKQTHIHTHTQYLKHTLGHYITLKHTHTHAVPLESAGLQNQMMPKKKREERSTEPTSAHLNEMLPGTQRWLLPYRGPRERCRNFDLSVGDRFGFGFPSFVSETFP